MKTVLFITHFPTDQERDGIFQRVLAIDKEFKGCRRIYLDIGRRNCFLGKREDMGGNLTILNLNFFVHYFKIQSIINKSDAIYFHSLYNFKKVLFFNINRKTVILDFHGCVPEELSFSGKKYLSKMYAKIEKMAVIKSSKFVCVSEEMKCFYEKKYPSILNKTIVVKPIYSSDVFRESKKDEIDNLKDSLGIKSDDCVILYSGNLQKWQNVDMMLAKMVQCNRKDFFFIILTGQEKEMNKRLQTFNGFKNLRYVILSVAPKEIHKFYQCAHYGFILRDDHVLNRIAAPTKLVEYLYYGLTPIVLCEYIGDAYKLGYEYVKVNEDLNSLYPHKCINNIQIAKRMATNFYNANFLDLIS